MACLRSISYGSKESAKFNSVFGIGKSVSYDSRIKVRLYIDDSVFMGNLFGLMM